MKKTAQDKLTSTDNIQDLFSQIWDNDQIYYENYVPDQATKLESWSNGNLTHWIKNLIDNKNKKINVLDLGCGLGCSAAAILGKFASNVNYTGVDLIDLTKTKKFLKEYNFNSLNFINEDISTVNAAGEWDLVISIGAFHHTPSTEKAIKNAIMHIEKNDSSIEKSSRMLLGWIINEQKPLRALTDTFFRNYFKKLEMEDQFQESLLLADLSTQLGDILKGKKLKIPKNINSLNIDKGEYDAQNFLYDFLIKFPLMKNINFTTMYIMEWFSPTYYHQTSRKQLHNILRNYRHEIYSKINGHFFKIETGDLHEFNK
jgi:cyclopropane fatty-acyl-phospholipid synthase-like methyltransferase